MPAITATGPAFALRVGGSDKRAIEAVLLYVELLALVLFKQGRWSRAILLECEVKKHFPIFAARIGLAGPDYEVRSGTCQAIELFKQAFEPGGDYFDIMPRNFPSVEKYTQECAKNAQKITIYLRDEELLAAAEESLAALDMQESAVPA